MSFSFRLALLSVAVLACAGCPSDDWIPYSNGMCYRLVKIFAPWYTVNDICDYGNPGAEAVSVHDLLQNAFLAETVALGWNVWLGLKRFGPTNPWVWSDGSQFNYSNWKGGEPVGDCAFINYGLEGEWAAMDCDVSSIYFLCQIAAQNRTTRPT